MPTKDPLDTVPAKLEAMDKRLDKGGERMGAMEGRLGRLETQMAENTQLTRDIKDAVVAGRIGKKVVIVLGALAAAGTAIWVFAYQLFHGGKLPGQ